jgi:hypothetical protein
MWSQIPTRLGTVIGAGFAWLIERCPSALTVALFGVGIFGYISVVGSLIGQAVVLAYLWGIDTVGAGLG